MQLPPLNTRCTFTVVHAARFRVRGIYRGLEDGKVFVEQTYGDGVRTWKFKREDVKGWK